jgi:hypothetical protein
MAWVCASCNSTNVEIAVEWGDSLESVEQRADTLEPSTCDPSVCRVMTGLCNSCGAQGDAHEIIVKGRATGVRPPGQRGRLWEPEAEGSPKPPVPVSAEALRRGART